MYHDMVIYRYIVTSLLRRVLHTWLRVSQITILQAMFDLIYISKLGLSLCTTLWPVMRKLDLCVQYTLIYIVVPISTSV